MDVVFPTQALGSALNVFLIQVCKIAFVSLLYIYMCTWMYIDRHLFEETPVPVLPPPNIVDMTHIQYQGETLPPLVLALHLVLGKFLT